MTHRAQVLIPASSGIPADNATNTFHFEALAEPGQDFENIVDMLADFYTEQAPDANNSIAAYMSAAVDGTAQVKIYDLNDPEPRTPVYLGNFALSGAGGEAMPSEVAVCLSWQAEPVSGQSQQSKRNRVYLGPWAVPSVENGRPNQLLIENIFYAAKELHAAADASIQWEWVVYSPSTDTARPIWEISVDNAFDTQRRRGIDPTARAVYYP